MDHGISQKSPVWIVSTASIQLIDIHPIAPWQTWSLPSRLMHNSSLTASSFQRTFIRKHQHSSLYSMNNFRRWPNEPPRFYYPRYRGKRNRTEHKQKRQWFPWSMAQLPQDENTWLMLVWKEEKDSQGTSTRENSAKKPRGQLVVFLHFGWRWNCMKCLYFKRYVGTWLFLSQGTVLFQCHCG